MITSVVELALMPDIAEYKTIEDAAKDARVPFTAYWIRILCQREKIEARKFGSGARATWLVHMPSLLAYIEEMQKLGTQKHASG